jgi:hypothetical protein
MKAHQSDAHRAGERDHLPPKAQRPALGTTSTQVLPLR